MNLYSYTLTSNIDEYLKIVKYLNTKKFTLNNEKLIQAVQSLSEEIESKNPYDIDYIAQVRKLHQMQGVLQNKEDAGTSTIYNNLLTFNYHHPIRHLCLEDDTRKFRVSIDFSYCLPQILALLLKDPTLADIKIFETYIEHDELRTQIDEVFSLCITGELTNINFDRLITNLSFKNTNLDKYIKCCINNTTNTTSQFVLLNEVVRMNNPTFQEAFLLPITYYLSKIFVNVTPKLKSRLGRGNGVVRSMNMFEIIFDVNNIQVFEEINLTLDGVKLTPKIEITPLNTQT